MEERWRGQVRRRERKKQSRRRWSCWGVKFAQQARIIPGSDGRTIAHIKCFKCNKMGHYSDCCPDAVEGDQMHINAYEIEMNDHEDDEDEGEDETTDQQDEETEVSCYHLS